MATRCRERVVEQRYAHDKLMDNIRFALEATNIRRIFWNTQHRPHELAIDLLYCNVYHETQMLPSSALRTNCDRNSEKFKSNYLIEIDFCLRHV